MGRKALFIALTAVVALALVPAGASAAIKPLTEERATVLATKLGREVAKERNVRFWRIQRLVKKRTNRFVFEYFERLRTNDRFCKASVIVEQRGTRRTARLSGSRCGTIRAEVLALEDAIADALRAVEPRTPDVRRSVNAFEEELEPCIDVNFPDELIDEIDDFTELGVELSIYDPVMAELDAFVARLANSGVTDPVLQRGVTSWRKYLEILRDVPPVARDACPALREWARDDFSDESRPVDFARTDALHRSLVRHGRAILDAGDRLFLLGVSERTYTAFTPYGLITSAAVDFGD